MSDYLYSCQNGQQLAEVRNINHLIFLSVKFTQQFHKSVINFHILDFEDGRFSYLSVTPFSCLYTSLCTYPTVCWMQAVSWNCLVANVSQGKRKIPDDVKWDKMWRHPRLSRIYRFVSLTDERSTLGESSFVSLTDERSNLGESKFNQRKWF